MSNTWSVRLGKSRTKRYASLVGVGVLAVLLTANPSCSASLSQQELSSLRDTLLTPDPIDRVYPPPGAREGRLRAIERLEADGSVDAIAVLEAFLTTPGANRVAKQHAVMALGRTDTPDSVAAIRRFVAWADERRHLQSALELARMDHAIDHFVPHIFKIVGEGTDDSGVRWSLFWWHRYGRRDLWMTRAQATEGAIDPVLIDLRPEWLTGLPDDSHVQLEIQNGVFRIEHGQDSATFTLDEQTRDQDEDGLTDSVERLLGTGLDDPDSDDDSTNDGDDANPLSPGVAQNGDLSQIRQAVFTLMFATCNSQDAVVMAGSGEYTVQEYHGFSGVVLRSHVPRTGWVNITKFDVDLRSPDKAVVSLVDYVASLAAKGRTITVRKTHGHWVATELCVDWLS